VVRNSKPRMVSNRKHLHWVPEFYLRYFATPETRSAKRPQVWIFSKEASDQDESLTWIRNVCGKRYLYAPLEPDGGRDWGLEDQLERLETTLGKIWKELAEGFVNLDDSAIRKGVSLFVAVMHLRNLETRKMVETIHRQLVAFFADMPSRPDGAPGLDSVEIEGRTFPVDAEGWHEFHSWGKNDHDKLFVDIVRSEAIWIAEMLMKSAGQSCAQRPTPSSPRISPLRSSICRVRLLVLEHRMGSLHFRLGRGGYWSWMTCIMSLKISTIPYNSRTSVHSTWASGETVAAL